MQLDDTICYCFHITKRKIVNFVRVHRPRRASQISECGGAGTGCGWCVNYLKRYFEQSQQATLQASHEQPAKLLAEADPLTPDEYAAQRAAYIRAGHGKPASGAIPLPAATSCCDETPPPETK